MLRSCVASPFYSRWFAKRVFAHEATNLHNQSRLLNILDKLSKQASGILAELLANPASKRIDVTGSGRTALPEVRVKPSRTSRELIALPHNACVAS